MAKDVEMMSKEQFEEDLARFGPKVGSWPDHMRGAAHLFAETDTGKCLLADARQLDQLFCELRYSEQGDTATDHAGSFMERLSQIPGTHVQEIAGPMARLPGLVSDWSLSSFFGQLFDPARLFSARGLVSQGVFAAVLLVSGIVVGLEAVQTDLQGSYEDYDISAGLFGDEEQDLSFDG